MPKALITGISGQDGSYLAEFLLKKGYQVIGTTRNSGTLKLPFDFPKDSRIEIAEIDLLGQQDIQGLLSAYHPDEVYNLAGFSSLLPTFEDPVLTGECMALAVTRFLESIRRVNPSIRFFQASSSEMFGEVTKSPQDEDTPFKPRNPYGVAKMYGHLITRYYRVYKDMFSCSGILYNHESPRRRPEFVSRKVTQGVASIKLGLASELRLGNLDALRDWGFAGDYVEAMWLLLQYPTPGDYVLATGEAHTVREICEIAFSRAGLNYMDHVISEPDASRPPEPFPLIGNPGKARRLLGWKPRMNFRELIDMMVDQDLKMLRGEIPEK